MLKKIICVLLTAMLLPALSACSSLQLPEVNLPPLPGTAAAQAEEQKVPEAAETQQPSVDFQEVAVESETEPKPEAITEENQTDEIKSEETDSIPEPETTQTQEVNQAQPALETPPQIQPEVTVTPQTQTQPEQAQSQAPAAKPVISVLNETRPTDIERYQSVDLRGVIQTDCGVITQVYAVILNSSGEAVQDCAYYPNTKNFYIAGTVNECLRFGYLEPGDYVYQLNASAKNGDNITSSKLTEVSFKVNSPHQKAEEAQTGADATQESNTGNQTEPSAYSAKLTEDTSNEGQIWNYLILQLNNPYAAAGILGNIQAESSCLPYIVENDTSKGRSFSISYTESADNGTISRDAFAYSPPGDSLGYGFGLCQWTMERKGNLYDYAKNAGISLNSIDTQCGFLMQELNASFASLLEYLKTCTDAREACRRFCSDYEKASAWGSRTDYASDYLEKYAKN